MNDELNYWLRQLALDYKLFTPEMLEKADDNDIYAQIVCELETKFELEASLCEAFSCLGRKAEWKLSDKSMNTKAWYLQWNTKNKQLLKEKKNGRTIKEEDNKH